MSINWVMLSDKQGFVLLHGEQRLYTSPPRTSLALQSFSRYPGQVPPPFSLSHNAGTVHLTNRRIVYLPTNPTAQFQSFAAPILNIQDSHVTAPWFGPNAWVAMVKPVQQGGIPPEHQGVELKMTFNDGGAYDFHSNYERTRERLQQAVEVARASGQISGDGSERTAGRGSAALDVINMDSVHLDELPAYEPTIAPSSSGQSQQPSIQVPITPSILDSEPPEVTNAPAEPPPGYEEVQRRSVTEALERDLRIRDD